MGTIFDSIGLLLRPGFAAGGQRVQAYQRAFAATVLGDADIPALAFWKARVGIYATLRAMKLSPADEVVVPAYTCEMVPAAVKFAGARCVYADVGEGDVNTTPQTIAAATGPQTRAILVQHTYGLAQGLAEIRALAAKSGAKVLADCCQLIETQKVVAGKELGDAAFFSTQWSKPYSTGLGGMAAFGDRDLYERCRQIRETFSHEGDRKRSRSLAMQLLLYTLLVRPRTREMIAIVYRQMQKANLVKGTTAQEEYGQEMPADYPAAATNVQATVGLGQLAKWQRNVEHRRMLTDFYVQQLSAMGLRQSKPCPEGWALWAVPLMVKNKFHLVSRAARGGLPLATWFDVMPVHADPRTAARYDCTPGQCPRAEAMFMNEVHLLTGPSVTLAKAAKAIKLIQSEAQLT